MEREAGSSPDTIPNLNEMMNGEQANDGRDVVVEASADEIKALDALGPDSDEVKDWLAKNSINENDRIIANGNVYTAKPDDFLTRDVAATQAWAVNAARSMVDGIESRIDQHSAEIGEEESRIDTDFAKEAGEVVLDVVEVNEPIPEEAEATAEEHEEHTEKLRYAINTAINHIESEGQAVGLGRRTIVENIRSSVAQLSSSLRHYEDYPTASMRTILQNTVQGLYGVVGAAGRYSEGSVTDALKSLDAVEQALNDSQGVEGVAAESFQQELGDVEPVRQDLRHAGEVVGALRGNGLASYANKLESIIQTSYSRQIDISEIQHIATAIERLAADGGDLDEAIRKAGRSLDAFVHNLHTVRARLPE